MATRMQQRRGTAAQWTAADPILGSGEIGFETDTGEFRVGDGISNWSDLSPFKNIVDLGGNLDDYVPLTSVGANDGVAPLNSTGEVPLANLGLVLGNIDTSRNNLGKLNDAIPGDIAAAINTERTSISTEIQETVDAKALLIAEDYTNDINQAKIDVTNTASSDATTKANTAQANAETTASGYVATHAADTTSVHGISDTSTIVFTTDTGTVTDLMIANGAVSTDRIKAGAVTSAKIANGTIVNEDISATAEIAQSKIQNLQFDLATKAPTENPTFAGTLTAATVSITGDLTVGGTTTTVNASNLTVADPLVYFGEGNTSNVVDLGFVASYNDGTYHHAGLARDASDNKWKLFSSVEDEPTTTINFAQAEYDTLVVGGIEYSDGIQVKQGVPSITSINQKTSSYTTVLSDRDKLVEISSSSGVTVTIPTDASVAYPVGTSIDILQTNTGQVTIAGASGVTVNATPGLKLRTQWSSATLFKRATDTWVVFGDLTA